MKKLIACIIILMFSSCAYRPIVDIKGVNQTAYNQDLCECQQYAESVSVAGSGATGTLIGAAAGAILGGALSAILGGDVGKVAAAGAVSGAAMGSSSAAGDAAMTKAQIVRKCLQGRGYNVLN